MPILTLVATGLAQHGDVDDVHEEPGFWANLWDWVTGDGLWWVMLGLVVVAIVAVVVIGFKVAGRASRPSEDSDPPVEP